MSAASNTTSEGGGDTSNNNNATTSNNGVANANNTNVPARETAIQYPQLEDKSDFAIVKWLAGFEPHNLPEALSSAFRLGPLQDKLKITKPIVWLANLSCDFKSAYDTIDDPHDVFGPTLGGRRRASDGKRTYPRPFTAAEKKRFELLQDEYHNQRWQNLLVLGYDPATAATMVGALRDKHMRVFSPPPLFTLSPRMIVTDEEKRMKMKATVMGYLDGLAKQAEKELLEDLDREIAEEQEQQANSGNKGKNAKKKAKKKAAAAAKKKTEIISSTSGDSSSQTQPPPQQPPLKSTAPPPAAAATTTNETVEEKRRRIEFAVAEARRKQNEAEQLKLQQKEKEQQQQQQEEDEEDNVHVKLEGTRPGSPGPLSPDQMKYLREQQQKQKPSMLENYDERDRQIIREALERTGLKEEDVTKDVTTTSEKDGKGGMPYAWCCDFCKTATFPTFAEAALHETTCAERPKTEEEIEADRILSLEKHNKFTTKYKTDETRGENNDPIKVDVHLDSRFLDELISVNGGGLPKSSTRQRGTFAAKTLASKSKEVNVAELMESLALEWSEKKGKDEELSKESSTDSKKKVEDEKAASISPPVIPSVDYSDDESDSDDDLNLEQFVKTASSKATPAKKTALAATAVKPKIIAEVASQPLPEKTSKQTPSEKDVAKALSKKEKKKAAAAAKKEKKKAAAAAAAAAAAIAASPTANVNMSKESTSTSKQKKVAPPAVADKTISTKESSPPQISQKRPPPGLIGKSPVPMEIAQAMKSSTLDYSDRVNDTALPQPPARSTPVIALDHTSDLFIMQEAPPAPPQASPSPHQVQPQLPNISSPTQNSPASRPMSPSVINRMSALAADNELLTAKADFLESENQSLRAEVEALRNQITIDRQNAVEALQRVQLKSYISETAKDAAEERAAWLEAVLVDAVAELTTREVVRIETNEAIKAVSYAAVQPPAPSPSYHPQPLQQPLQRPSVLPPLGDADQHNSTLSSLPSRRSTNGDVLDSFSFEGDFSLGNFSTQNSGGILPQAPWPRDEGVFARLRRGDDA